MNINSLVFFKSRACIVPIFLFLLLFPLFFYEKIISILITNFLSKKNIEIKFRDLNPCNQLFILKSFEYDWGL